MVKRPDLLASKAVALSPPSDGLLGRWELRTVTKYGTKRFHESVWNDSDIYNGCDVIYCNQIRCNVIQKFHESKLWPNPCNSHVIHTASAYSTCVWRSCVRVFGSKPCAALRVEVCRWRGAGSCSAKVFESFQLGTGTCHKRRSDGDRPEFGHPHESSQVLEGSGQKHQLLLVQFLPRVPNLTRHIASKWVGSCYCWSPIQTKAWKPTISLVLLQLSRQEKPGWKISWNNVKT